MDTKAKLVGDASEGAPPTVLVIAQNEALSAKVEFCTQPFVMAGLAEGVGQPRLTLRSSRIEPRRHPRGPLSGVLFALRYTDDFEGGSRLPSRQQPRIRAQTRKPTYPWRRRHDAEGPAALAGTSENVPDEELEPAWSNCAGAGQFPPQELRHAQIGSRANTESSAPKIVRSLQKHADAVVALELLSTANTKPVTSMRVAQVILTVQSEVADHALVDI